MKVRLLLAAAVAGSGGGSVTGCTNAGFEGDTSVERFESIESIERFVRNSLQKLTLWSKRVFATEL